jgi:hypothetical protein
MRNLGRFTTALMITATVGAVIVAVRSLPDVRRYFKIRQMFLRR